MEDDLEEKVRELTKKCSDQEGELEETKRKVQQLEHEKEVLESMSDLSLSLSLSFSLSHPLPPSLSLPLSLLFIADLEAAEEKHDKAKKELESTLAELNEI